MLCKDVFNIENMEEVSKEELLNRFHLRGGQEFFTFERDSIGNIQMTTARGEYDSEGRSIAKPKFSSLRRLGPQNSNAWNSEREMKMIFLYEHKVPGLRLKKTSEWKLLPKDLIQVFESGQILTTEPNGKHDIKYAVLMAVADIQGAVSLSGGYRETRLEGRTGLLFQYVDYRFVPVVVRNPTTGIESLVELKGVGPPDRKGYDQKGGYEFRGGVTVEEALREFREIQSNSDIEKNGVRTPGVITFFNEKFKKQQGYTLRLVPGNARVSYRINDSLVKYYELDERVASFMGTRWAAYYSRGLIPATHPENIIVTENGRTFYMTDFSDILNAKDFPMNLEGRVRTLRDTFGASMQAVTQLPTYNQNVHFVLFKNAFASELQNLISVPDANRIAIKGAASMKELEDVVFEFLKGRSFPVN